MFIISRHVELLASKDGLQMVGSLLDWQGLLRNLGLSYWRDEDAIKAWRNNEKHRLAQTIGQENFFKNYRIHVATVTRQYSK